jgi:hypothetical protein
MFLCSRCSQRSCCRFHHCSSAAAGTYVEAVVAFETTVLVHAAGTGGRSSCSLGRPRHHTHGRPTPSPTKTSRSQQAAGVPRRRGWLHARPDYRLGIRDGQHLTAKAGPRQFSIHPAPPLALPWVGFGLGTLDNSLTCANRKKNGACGWVWFLAPASPYGFKGPLERASGDALNIEYLVAHMGYDF